MPRSRTAWPARAGPWFFSFGGDGQFHPVMTPADLRKAGLDALGKQWS